MEQTKTNEPVVDLTADTWDMQELWYELIIRRVAENPYIPQFPTAKQQVFLVNREREVLFGGAAGPGKSSGLLMASLMFVDLPDYNALLLRRTYTDLALPESIMDRAEEWLTPTDAHWNGNDYRWEFPSGATLSFGYLASDKDKYRYQSSAFQFVGYDELTQFEIGQYTYLFSRQRRLKKPQLSIWDGRLWKIPIRMRSATNPGGVGHDWVFDRFIVNKKRTFIPALMAENPHLDQDEYRESLSELDDTTRRQLEDGEWVVGGDGKSFDSAWWRGKSRFLMGEREQVLFRIHSWDTALTNTAKAANSADIIFEVLADYRIRVVGVWAGKPLFTELTDQIEKLFKAWDGDERTSAVVIEGMASGKPAIQTLRSGANQELAAKIIEFVPKESKEERANRAAVWCKRGLVLLPHPDADAPWLADFEMELFNFPYGGKKDRVDAFSQGILYLENYLVAAWHGQIAKKQRSTPRDNRVAKALREGENAGKKQLL